MSRKSLLRRLLRLMDSWCNTFHPRWLSLSNRTQISITELLSYKAFFLLSGKDRLTIVYYSTDSSGFHRLVKYCTDHAFFFGLLRDERPVAVNAFTILIPSLECTQYSCCGIYIPGEVDCYGYFRTLDPVDLQILFVENNWDVPGKHFARHRYWKIH